MIEIGTHDSVCDWLVFQLSELSFGLHLPWRHEAELDAGDALLAIVSDPGREPFRGAVEPDEGMDLLVLVDVGFQLEGLHGLLNTCLLLSGACLTARDVLQRTAVWWLSRHRGLPA